MKGKRKIFVPGSKFMKTGIVIVLLILCLNCSLIVRKKLETQIDFWNKKYESVFLMEELKNMEARK